MTVEELMLRLRSAIGPTQRAYHRLTLLAGTPGSGKTAAVRSLAAEYAVQPVNVNLELSQRLLKLPRNRWARSADPLFRELLASAAGEPVFLDNLELLFDPALQLDPLRLLQNASRQRTIVAAWSGLFRDGLLTYAEPDHPEFRSYRNVEVPIVAANPESAAGDPSPRAAGPGEPAGRESPGDG